MAQTSPAIAHWRPGIWGEPPRGVPRHVRGARVRRARARRARTSSTALFLDHDAAAARAPTVARLLAAELGRDEAWQTAQLQAFAATTALTTPN